MDNIDYCNSGSLDTFIYLLQEKKSRVNVITQQDDSSCSNPEKSTIDLMDYPEGEYIIAVGGYGSDVGNFWIHLTADENKVPHCNSCIADVLIIAISC